MGNRDYVELQDVDEDADDSASPKSQLLQDNAHTTTNKESKEQYKARWKTIHAHFLTLLLNAVVTTIVYSSLWTYLKMMDPETSTWYLGAVHAAFNSAELFAVILFGAWVQYRSGFEPLVCSLVSMIIGSALYAWALSFGYVGKFLVLVARMFIGCSTGNDVIVTILICDQTTIKERTKVMAYCSLASSIGFMIGPALQASLVPFGTQGYFFKVMYLRINMYTMAGILCIVFGIINLVVAWMYCKTDIHVDPYIDVVSDEEMEELRTLKDKDGNSNNKKKKNGRFENSPDILAVVAVLMMFFVVRHCLVFIEVMFAPMAMDEYALSDSDTVLYVGVILALAGFLSAFAFIGTEKVAAWVGDRIPLLISLGILLIAFVIQWPLSHKYPKLGHFYTTMENTTEGIVYKKHVTPGCSPTHSWCKTTPIITLEQFAIGLSLVIMAFPVSYCILPSLFTKIIPTGRQGLLVSLFSVAGNISRIFGPALFTTLYSYYGPKSIFALMDIGLGFGLIIMIIIYKRLVPYKEYLKKNKKDALSER